MSIRRLSNKAPVLKDSKMLVFTHECDEGFNQYLVIVPKAYEAPQGTMGGEQPVEDTPEMWEKYDFFRDMLNIPFDKEDPEHFLWCSEESIHELPVVSADHELI